MSGHVLENCIPVYPGDHVLLKLGVFDDSPIVPATVINSKPRYAYRKSIGRTKPLIQVRIDETGEERHMDNSFVVKLMERATKAYGYPRNSCRKCNIGPRELRTERKAILAGPLHVLATAFMARLPFDLPHELDHEKLRNLYLRDGIGLVKCNGHTYWVRRKQFSRWIRKNAHRICVTTAEKIRRETAWDREYTQSYYRMVEADERWLDEELEEFLMNEEPPLEEVDYI